MAWREERTFRPGVLPNSCSTVPIRGSRQKTHCAGTILQAVVRIYRGRIVWKSETRQILDGREQKQDE